MRTILIHLNAQVADDDERTPEQVAEAILGAYGADAEQVRDVTVALAEEV